MYIFAVVTSSLSSLFCTFLSQFIVVAERVIFSYFTRGKKICVCILFSSWNFSAVIFFRQHILLASNFVSSIYLLRLDVCLRFAVYLNRIQFSFFFFFFCIFLAFCMIFVFGHDTFIHSSPPHSSPPICLSTCSFFLPLFVCAILVSLLAFTFPFPSCQCVYAQLAIFPDRFICEQRQLIAHFMQCWIGCAILYAIYLIVLFSHLCCVACLILRLTLSVPLSTHWHHQHHRHCCRCRRHHRYSCDKWQPISLVTADRLLTSHCLQVDRHIQRGYVYDRDNLSYKQAHRKV